METILAMIILSILIWLVIVWIRDTNRFIIVPYEVESAKLKKNATVVLLADLHNKSFGKKNEKLRKAIEESNPDMIMIAGDMLTSKDSSSYKNAAELLTAIQEKCPVYYANGNHEQKVKRNPETFKNAYETYTRQIQTENLCLLENESVYLPEYNINISGIEIERKFFKRIKKPVMVAEDVKRLVGKANRDAFQILLAHNPEYFDAYEAWGAELTLSGHIHGGIMKLPYLGGVISPSFRLFPKYDGGLFEKNGKKMILSRGLGTHTLPVRIFNAGELVIIQLKAKENE